MNTASAHGAPWNAWIVAAALMLSILAGYTAANQAVASWVVVGAVVAFLVSVARPEVAVSCGVMAALAGGGYAWISQLGQAWLVLTCVIVLVRHGQLINHEWGRVVAIPVLLLLWLAARLWVDTGWSAVRPLVSCLAVVLMVPLLMRQADRLVRGLAIAGAAFALASLLFGSYTGLDQRFEGISGNPNRMVLGLLLSVPFVLAFAFAGGRRLSGVLMAAPVCFLSSVLVLRSGSEQGLVQAAVLAGILTLLLTRKMPAALVVVVWAVLLLVAVWWALRVDLWNQLSADVRSLSGRTTAYGAGIEEVARSPIFGSGSTHVRTEQGSEISAHNSMLGITASAGILAGAAWGFLLVKSVASSLQWLRAGLVVGGAGILLAVAQLVQSVESVPLAWMALLVPLTIRIAAVERSDPE